MDRMGVNIKVNSWNGGQLAPALNLLVTTNGSSLIRVIRDPMDWVTRESLILAPGGARSLLQKARLSGWKSLKFPDGQLTVV
ncbi:MAG: hypothetical protein L0H94_00885 [Nitrospira sp.]|nr:hypothetical protein [Nitrospira sp.]